MKYRVQDDREEILNKKNPRLPKQPRIFQTLLKIRLLEPPLQLLQEQRALQV